MLNNLKIFQAIGRQLMRTRPTEDFLKMEGLFKAQLVRKGRIIAEFEGKNGITVTGKNLMLDTFFGKGTPVAQIDPWYIGLIDNSPTPVLSENDTLASHSGWTELTAYSGNRKTWVDADAASKIKGTTTAASFTFNATKTVYGIMIASASSGTSGTLWSTGAFDSTVDVVNLDVLNITYGVRL